MCGEISVSLYFYWHVLHWPGMWLQGLFWAQRALIGELIRREWTPAEVTEINTGTIELLYFQPITLSHVSNNRPQSVYGNLLPLVCEHIQDAMYESYMNIYLLICFMNIRSLEEFKCVYWIWSFFVEYMKKKLSNRL